METISITLIITITIIITIKITIIITIIIKVSFLRPAFPPRRSHFRGAGSSGRSAAHPRHLGGGGQDGRRIRRKRSVPGERGAREITLPLAPLSRHLRTGRRQGLVRAAESVAQLILHRLLADPPAVSVGAVACLRAPTLRLRSRNRSVRFFKTAERRFRQPDLFPL